MPRNSLGLGVLEISWALTLSFVTGMATYLWLDTPQVDPPTDTRLCRAHTALAARAASGGSSFQQQGDPEGWLSRANPY